MTSPPLRFLAVVIGGWVCLRAALLGPAWWTQTPAAPTPAAARGPAFARVEAE